MSPDREPAAGIDLVHPLYLDVPMMVSFLATLQDGVAFTSDVAESASQSTKAELEVIRHDQHP